jgi:hypothetical protein
MVSIELLRDELPPELRLKQPSSILLPWSGLAIEASEPLASTHLDVRVDGDLEAISPATPFATGTVISPDFSDSSRNWWPLGARIHIEYETGAVDLEGNERSAQAWAVDVVPDTPTRAISGTGGLVHWGNLEFDRGEHQRLAGQHGPGLFAMLQLDTSATTVSASVSICGSPGRRVRCKSAWSFPNEVPRRQIVEMTIDRLPSEGGCFSPPQTIRFGQSTGEVIAGTIGVAATFDNPDGSPLDDVYVVVHSIWADNDVGGGGS